MYINQRSRKFLAQIDQYAEILPFIKKLTSIGYIEIELPVGSTVYGDKIKTFLRDGCKICMQEGRLPRLTGYLKEQELCNYFIRALQIFNQSKRNAKQ